MFLLLYAIAMLCVHLFVSYHTCVHEREDTWNDHKGNAWLVYSLEIRECVKDIESGMIIYIYIYIRASFNYIYLRFTSFFFPYYIILLYLYFYLIYLFYGVFKLTLDALSDTLDSRYQRYQLLCIFPYIRRRSLIIHVLWMPKQTCT